jgi:hypothetical protein
MQNTLRERLIAQKFPIQKSAIEELQAVRALLVALGGSCSEG